MALATLKDTPTYRGSRESGGRGINIGYVGLGLAGLLLAGGLLYGIGVALFSPESGYHMQSLAMKYIEASAEAVNALGRPISYGKMRSITYTREDKEVCCSRFSLWSRASHITAAGDAGAVSHGCTARQR